MMNEQSNKLQNKLAKINGRIFDQFLKDRGLKAKGKPKNHVLLRIDKEYPNSIEIVTLAGVFCAINVENFEEVSKGLPKLIHRKDLWRYVGADISRRFWKFGLPFEPKVDGIIKEEKSDG